LHSEISWNPTKVDGLTFLGIRAKERLN
jgi:hypothetical protein